MRTFLALIACLLVLAVADAAAMDDIQMLPTRIKLDDSKKREKGNTTVESKDIAYCVKVTSRSFKEVNDVTIKYNIFYAVADFGSTAEPDVKVSTGSHSFPSLITNKPVEFETDAIKLEKASLDGNWFFSSGASGQARDKVVGVWLKAFDSTGKQIGEYTNPSTVSKKQKWKD